MTTDLSFELENLKVSLELDQKDFKPDDLSKFRTVMSRALHLMDQIYSDVTLIADKPVPERINEMQAYEFMQPALRIESRTGEVRRLLEQANLARQEVGRPREEADGNLAKAEQSRLQSEIDLANSRKIAGDLKAAYAENYPQVQAALLTAETEFRAASQMVTSSREALGRRSWREANDLARRSITLFESAAYKFQLIQRSNLDYSQASQQADEALKDGLKQLTTTRKLLTSQAAVLSHSPDHYLASAVQRLGEARRAFLAAPPQYVTALRLAKEARSLIDQGQAQAMDAVYKLKQTRLDAQLVLTSLNEAVQELRVSINAHRSVPVRANECYTKARTERDRLQSRESEIEKLDLPQLVELTTTARLALQIAQEGLKLIGP